MNPALSLALSRVLPTEEQTLLLRACLNSGEPGREAWAEFQRRGLDALHLLRHGSPDVRRIAPLLFAALRESGSPVDPGVLTVLRTAYLREEVRSGEYRRVCALVLSRLDAAGIPFVVFRGGALSETVYAHPALRHSHDLNLLVPAGERQAAVEALRRCGWHSRPESPEADAVIVDHESGLPILLHWQFFRLSFHRLDWDAFWSRTRAGRVAGRTVRLLSPADTLLHVCCQALHCVRLQPFVWAADGYLTIQRYPDLDWTELLQSARQSRTELPVRLALDYLARELSVSVPEAARARLAAATEAVDPVERDVALLAARRRGGIGLRRLLRESASMGVKLTSLRWLLLPSREYLEWAYGPTRSFDLPLAYVGRLGRYLLRRASWRFRRTGIGRPGAGRRTAEDERHLPAERV